MTASDALYFIIGLLIGVLVAPLVTGGKRKSKTLAFREQVGA